MGEGLIEWWLCCDLWWSSVNLCAGSDWIGLGFSDKCHSSGKWSMGEDDWSSQVDRNYIVWVQQEIEVVYELDWIRDKFDKWLLGSLLHFSAKPSNPCDVVPDLWFMASNLLVCMQTWLPGINHRVRYFWGWKENSQSSCSHSPASVRVPRLSPSGN